MISSLQVGVFSQTTLQLQKTGATRAVVAGISNYQDEAIPDLRYADKDAEALVAYLKSKAGGEVPDDNIILLKNEQATTAQIGSALDWLMEESEEGDIAFIYFSGHGDVETKTKMQFGYLLTYDSPPKVYVAGAFPLTYLQAVISTLSESGVQVVMISDACRAGKLAGSSVGGTQATSSVLAKQFSNEVKILSCQPNEYSLEGEQWGGGRGVFSYYLIDGLYGLADRNGDLQVSLLEIERYLEDQVPAQTAPQSQIPMTTGNKGARIGKVDEGLLAQLKQDKEMETPLLAMVDSRGLEDGVLEKADSLTRHQYANFKEALSAGNLLTPEGKSANDWYILLSKNKSIARLHNFMRRNLAAALQDEAQQAINAYLLADKKDLSNRINMGDGYAAYPAYLARAAELLGEQHYMYRSLKAKQLYFEAVLIRLDNQKKSALDSIYKEAISKLEKAMEFESQAAYIFNELGVNYERIKDYDKAIESYRKANDLAPTWILPYNNMGAVYYNRKQWDNARGVFKSLIKKDSTFQNAWYALGLIYKNTGDLETSEKMFLKASELLPDARVYQNLGKLYTKMEKNEAAEEMFEKAIELVPGNAVIHNEFANFYDQTRQFEKAERMYKKTIDLSPDNIYPRLELARVYYNSEREKQAEAIYQKTLEMKPGDPWNFFCLACYKAKQKDNAAALDFLKQALEKGFSDHAAIVDSHEFDEIRNERDFKKLMKRYFGHQ